MAMNDGIEDEYDAIFGNNGATKNNNINDNANSFGLPRSQSAITISSSSSAGTSTSPNTDKFARNVNAQSFTQNSQQLNHQNKDSRSTSEPPTVLIVSSVAAAAPTLPATTYGSLLLKAKAALTTTDVDAGKGPLRQQEDAGTGLMTAIPVRTGANRNSTNARNSTGGQPALKSTLFHGVVFVICLDFAESVAMLQLITEHGGTALLGSDAVPQLQQGQVKTAVAVGIDHRMAATATKKAAAAAATASKASNKSKSSRQSDSSSSKRDKSSNNDDEKSGSNSSSSSSPSSSASAKATAKDTGLTTVPASYSVYTHPSVMRSGVHFVITHALDGDALPFAAIAPPEGGGWGARAAWAGAGANTVPPLANASTSANSSSSKASSSSKRGSSAAAAAAAAAAVAADANIAARNAAVATAADAISAAGISVASGAKRTGGTKTGPSVQTMWGSDVAANRNNIGRIPAPAALSSGSDSDGTNAKITHVMGAVGGAQSGFGRGHPASPAHGQFVVLEDANDDSLWYDPLVTFHPDNSNGTRSSSSNNSSKNMSDSSDIAAAATMASYTPIDLRSFPTWPLCLVRPRWVTACLAAGELIDPRRLYLSQPTSIGTVAPNAFVVARYNALLKQQQLQSQNEQQQQHSADSSSSSAAATSAKGKSGGKSGRAGERSQPPVSLTRYLRSLQPSPTDPTRWRYSISQGSHSVFLAPPLPTPGPLRAHMRGLMQAHLITSLPTPLSQSQGGDTLAPSATPAANSNNALSQQSQTQSQQQQQQQQRAHSPRLRARAAPYADNSSANTDNGSTTVKATMMAAPAAVALPTAAAVAAAGGVLAPRAAARAAAAAAAAAAATTTASANTGAASAENIWALAGSGSSSPQVNNITLPDLQPETRERCVLASFSPLHVAQRFCMLEPHNASATAHAAAAVVKVPVAVLASAVRAQTGTAVSAANTAAETAGVAATETEPGALSLQHQQQEQARRDRESAAAVIDVYALHDNVFVPFAPVVTRPKGIVVCATQHTQDVKAAIYELVVMANSLRRAAYSDTLTTDVTHVIAMTGEGDKVAFARKHGIHVVNFNWLVESIRAGAPLDESFFPVD